MRCLPYLFNHYGFLIWIIFGANNSSWVSWRYFPHHSTGVLVNSVPTSNYRPRVNTNCFSKELDWLASSLPWKRHTSGIFSIGSSAHSTSILLKSSSYLYFSLWRKLYYGFPHGHIVNNTHCSWTISALHEHHQALLYHEHFLYHVQICITIAMHLFKHHLVQVCAEIWYIYYLLDFGKSGQRSPGAHMSFPVTLYDNDKIFIKTKRKNTWREVDRKQNTKTTEMDTSRNDFVQEKKREHRPKTRRYVKLTEGNLTLHRETLATCNANGS